MDIRDGRIYTPEQVQKLQKMMKGLRVMPFVSRERTEFLESKLDNLQPMEIAPTKVQMARRPPRVGRNEPCPCGSGKKFKKCCLRRVETGYAK